MQEKASWLVDQSPHLSLAKVLSPACTSARQGVSSLLVEERTRKWLLLKELAHFPKGVFHSGIESA